MTAVKKREADWQDDGKDFARLLGENLRRLRTRRGLSLERLAQASGVSRAMLGQVELGRSMPTVGVLLKIARSLDTSITALTEMPRKQDFTVIRAASSKTLITADGKVGWRSLVDPDGGQRLEFSELRITPGGRDIRPASLVATSGSLVVAEGTLVLWLMGEAIKLSAGDAITYNASLSVELSNPSDEDALCFSVLLFRQE